MDPSAPDPTTDPADDRHYLEHPSGFFATLIRRPVTLLVLLITLIVVGLIAYSRLPLQMMPDGLTEPFLEIQIQNPGSSPAENESKVTRVVEEQIRTLPSIRRITSGSGENGAWIWVAFQSDVDMTLAKADLRDRVERARPQLPDTVERIQVWSFSDDSLPLFFFALLNPGDSQRTDFLVENVIKRRIEAVDGVGKVEIWGMRDESIYILLDEDRVKELSLDIGALITRLGSDNFAQPLGEITDGGQRFILRSDMRFKSLDEIERYPIGSGLVIADVGRVIRSKAVRNFVSRIDGQNAYFGEISKDGQANAVEASAELRALLEELEQDSELAGLFDFRVLFDQGSFIENSLGQMRSTALWGGGLAVAILFLFLRRIRLTLCVALAIPISTLLAVAWVFFKGGTFNVLTMTGLTLGIGMLVDNAVVVVENIARLRAKGWSGQRAAVGGVHDVGLAVTLATLTTVVVFLPLIFMGENPMMRLMLGELGLPMCMSLVFSLFVALVFLPVVAARILGPQPGFMRRLGAVVRPVASIPYRLFSLVIGALRAIGYGLVVGAHAVERAFVLVATPLRWPLAAGALALAVYLGMRVATGFDAGAGLSEFGLGVPGLADAVEFQATWFWLPAAAAAALILLGLRNWRARAPRPPARPASFLPASGSFVDFLVDVNRGMVAWALEHRILATVFATLAVFSIVIPHANMNVSGFGEDENRSSLHVTVDLKDDFTLEEADVEMQRYEEHFEQYREEFGFSALACRFSTDWARISLYWEETQDLDVYERLKKRVRAEMPQIAGHDVSLRGDENEDSRAKNIVAFQLRGPNYERLMELGAEALEILEGVPGLQDLSSPIENMPKQVRVKLDSEVAHRFGVNAQAALQNISWALRGFTLPRYHERGAEVPMYIEYDDEVIEGLSTLRDLEIFTGEGTVPLASFAEIEFEPGTQSIYRRNGKATFTITGTVENPAMQGRMTLAGYAALRSLNLPRGYELGTDDSLLRRQEEELGALKNAALLGFVLVILLMAILLESLVLPFAVIPTVPFAVVGAYWTLYVTGTTMDSVGWIGIIILIGVVVNNGIVLIDRIHRLRLEGMERKAAVLEGAANRVRPILMTAMTTIGGLLPMALSQAAADGIDYRALATCVSGGLAFSTIFTVWVVPLTYTLADDFGAALRRVLGYFATRPLVVVQRLVARRARG